MKMTRSGDVVHRSPGLGRRRCRITKCARLAHALAQQVEETLLRHRRCHQDALAEVEAHDHERLQLGLRLDAFPDGGTAEAVREIDRGMADCGIGGLARAVAHEGLVDLELGERQAAKARQQGIAGAEVIDRDLDAADLQARRGSYTTLMSRTI
jgi:hypothetical protein